MLMPDFPTFWGAWSAANMYGLTIESIRAPDTAAAGDSGSLGTGGLTQYCPLVRWVRACGSWDVAAQWSVRALITPGYAWVCQTINISGMGVDDRCWATDQSGNVLSLKINSLIQGTAWGGEVQLP
jgi:hypothetical protein